MKNSYMLCPCGTSLLTNSATSEGRGLIAKYSNTKTPESISQADQQALQKILNHIDEQISSFTTEEAKKASAELNGILSYFNSRPLAQGDFIDLYSTDTWLGESTANFIKTWLQTYHSATTINVRRISDLQTTDLESFQSALSDIVKTLSEEIPAHKQAGYHIIFNLTGGFKSVQGFLQSIAHFYADETIYIFERSEQLMRIPKLPIQFQPEDTVRNNLEAFRRLAKGLSAECSKIPETLLLKIDNEVALSPWGELIWEQSYKTIYSEKLYPAPSPRISYSNSFEGDCAKLTAEQLQRVNAKLDDLANYIETGINPKSLDFKKLVSKQPTRITHEMDAWSDQDARRIFCHYEQEKLILDRLDKGLH